MVVPMVKSGCHQSKSWMRRCNLQPWPHMLSSHTMGRCLRKKVVPCQAPEVFLCEPSLVGAQEGAGRRGKPCPFGKTLIWSSQPQQRTRQVSWKKLRGGERKIRRRHLKNWGWAWIPNCQRSFPRSMPVCGVPAFRLVAPGSCLPCQPGWWQQNHQLPFRNAVPILSGLLLSWSGPALERNNWYSLLLCWTRKLFAPTLLIRVSPVWHCENGLFFSFSLLATHKSH